MVSSTSRQDLPAVRYRAVGSPTVEILVQVALIGGAWLLVDLLEGRETPERALATLSFAAAVAASILLAVAVWMSDDARARPSALAVGLYTVVALPLRAVDVGSQGGYRALIDSIAVLGVLGLMALSFRGGPGRGRNRVVAGAVLIFVAGGISAVTLTRWLVPDHVPAAVVVSATDMVAWSGVGMLGVLLLVTGAVLDRPTQRRTGLGFATLGIAHTIRLAGGGAGPHVSLAAVLELAAVAMFLVAAVPLLVSAVRAVGREQLVSRTRLAEVEATMAAVEERDHELRNLVAGLSGAAQVLTGDEAGASQAGRRLLVAAGAEIERLQRMLDGVRADPQQPDVAVGPLLSDLARVHRAGGADVRVDVTEDLRAAVAPAALAQVLTNLLVNCARHAPGARVWLTARERRGQVLIDVVDDGPGLPPGPVPALLQRGVRGPRSTGDGLGLAITAELVERHAGTFTLTSGAIAGDRRGCTAALRLPVAKRAEAVSA